MRIFDDETCDRTEVVETLVELGAKLCTSVGSGESLDAVMYVLHDTFCGLDLAFPPCYPERCPEEGDFRALDTLSPMGETLETAHLGVLRPTFLEKVDMEGTFCEGSDWWWECEINGEVARHGGFYSRTIAKHNFVRFVKVRDRFSGVGAEPDSDA